MKHRSILCLLLAFLLLLAACGETGGEKPEETAPAGQTAGRYALSEGGEAIVNDVDLSHYAETEDNARVFYEIFVGSFSDSDGDGIGDLRGIINRFDYLNDGDPASGLSLGVEGIWLTPIYKSPMQLQLRRHLLQ